MEGPQVHLAANYATRYAFRSPPSRASSFRSQSTQQTEKSPSIRTMASDAPSNDSMEIQGTPSRKADPATKMSTPEKLKTPSKVKTPSKLSTPSKFMSHRKASIGSMLSLPSFGVRGKQIKESLSGMVTKSSPPEPVKKRTPSINISMEEATSFRCDIHALHSTDYDAAEAECKQMVSEAGGEIIDDFLYPGGFFYDMTKATDENPLDDGDETADGGYITITPWTRFKPAQFNPLRMHPVRDRAPQSLFGTPTRSWPRRGEEKFEKQRVGMKDEDSSATMTPNMGTKSTPAFADNDASKAGMESVESIADFSDRSATPVPHSRSVSEDVTDQTSDEAQPQEFQFPVRSSSLPSKRRANFWDAAYEKYLG